MAKIQNLAVGTLKFKGNEITRIVSRTSAQGNPISIPVTFGMPVRFYYSSSVGGTLVRNRDGRVIGGGIAGRPLVFVDGDPQSSETYDVTGGGTWTVRAVLRTR